jgi:hypothetical protein
VFVSVALFHKTASSGDDAGTPSRAHDGFLHRAVEAYHVIGLSYSPLFAFIVGRVAFNVAGEAAGTSHLG